MIVFLLCEYAAEKPSTLSVDDVDDGFLSVHTAEQCIVSALICR